MKPSLIVCATAVLLCTSFCGSTLAQSSVLREADQRYRLQKAVADAEAKGSDAANFIVIAPGVVKDKRTGLEWMRCSMGQDWSEIKKTCEGSLDKYKFRDARDVASKLNNFGGFQGKTDWRLPTVRELQSLRTCSTGFSLVPADIQDGGSAVPIFCNEGSAPPTFAQTVFPRTEADGSYWTASPYVGDTRFAWVVSFYDGYVKYDFPTSRAYVRLVR